MIKIDKIPFSSTNKEPSTTYQNEDRFAGKMSHTIWISRQFAPFYLYA